MYSHQGFPSDRRRTQRTRRFVGRQAEHRLRMARQRMVDARQRSDDERARGNRPAATRERFAWTPKRCNLSNKRIWLKKCMMGVAMWTGPGEPVFEFKWHDMKEHLFWVIKQ